jgi:hypothetical protein
MAAGGSGSNQADALDQSFDVGAAGAAIATSTAVPFDFFGRVGPGVDHRFEAAFADRMAHTDNHRQHLRGTAATPSAPRFVHRVILRVVLNTVQRINMQITPGQRMRLVTK